MKLYRNLILILAVVGLLAVLSPNAKADIFEQKVRVTFSQPVEVPGLVLPAGTYVFEMLPNEGLTRILSSDERRVYANLFTVPEQRPRPADKATFILEEGRQGVPERVQSWFYPGELTGSEFIYTRHHVSG